MPRWYRPLLRTEMLRQAVGTLEAATLAASASHGLIKVGARKAPSTAERRTLERKGPYPGARRRDGFDRRL
jgi:hypothetical protein